MTIRKRPGGEVAYRPLHFIWICDCSGSMSLNGKIQSLNNAIRETLPHMREVAEENPNAQVLVRTLKFSTGAEWHVNKATRLEDFKWTDLIADPLQTPTVDIVFLVDTSGSMSDEIESVKGSCISFADTIIKEGANVRLGLVGFDIGGFRGGRSDAFTVHKLSTYTIGIWPLTSPRDFRRNVQSLSLGMFGGGGCYLANRDTVDIFPHVVRTFSGPPENSRVLIIISDEIGGVEGVTDIVSQLKDSAITTHVMDVPGHSGAHESIARQTGGKFWDITRTKGVHNFGDLLDTVAKTIAREVTKSLADGNVSLGTDMGTALSVVAAELKIPPMTDRALPPVLVLVSDGQPTDNFARGLKTLMDQPWGKKAVRIAIAIGKDADLDVLQKFLGNNELKPLLANNPDALVNYIRWASTAVLKVASAPASQSKGSATSALNLPPPIVEADKRGPRSSKGVW